MSSGSDRGQRVFKLEGMSVLALREFMLLVARRRPLAVTAMCLMHLRDKRIFWCCTRDESEENLGSVRDDEKRLRVYALKVVRREISSGSNGGGQHVLRHLRRLRDAGFLVARGVSCISEGGADGHPVQVPRTYLARAMCRYASRFPGAEIWV